MKLVTLASSSPSSTADVYLGTAKLLFREDATIAQIYSECSVLRPLIDRIRA